MKYNTLENLKTGESATILSINPECTSMLRLLDMGFTKGTVISPIWYRRDNKIRAYRIKGTLIGIRLEDAKYINIFS